MSLDELKAKLDGLSSAKLKFVARMLDSLSNEPRTLIDQPTWLTAPDWVEYFATSLSLHHSLTTQPLAQAMFETAFRNACESIGWEVTPTGSATQRFVDLHVTLPDGQVRKLSLKSTAAKHLSKNVAHISKLTEAAWIQDARTARMRREQTQRLFREYQGLVDSIIMLRAFRGEGETPNLYQLLEIPTSIFSPIQRLPVQMFGSESSALKCEIDGKTAAVVALDRSDAKITIRGIRISNCTVHAGFVLEGS